MSDVEFVILDRNRPPAEVIPHPAWSRRIAEDVLRDIDDLASPSWRRKCLTDAVRAYRGRLEQLGVKPERIAVETAALELIFFGAPSPLRRRA